jgi:hypothetical protein
VTMSNRSLFEKLDITYTTGVDEPVHPDPAVASRFVEVGITLDCGYGCKIYADPLSRVNVLGHNRTYGCKTTREHLDADLHPVHDEWFSTPECTDSMV